MLSVRAVILSILSAACAIGTLYFALVTHNPGFFSVSSIPIDQADSAEMTIHATKFDPEVLLSAPRRSPAAPNADGNLAVYTVSTYSFETHKKTSEIRVLDVESGHSTLITNDEKASEPNWLEVGNDLLWLKSVENGATELIVGSVNDIGKTYIAGTVSGPISNVRLKVLQEGKVAIAVTGKARPDGSMYNPKQEPKKQSTGLVYDSLMVRHWDQYTSNKKNAIWYGILQRSTPHTTESEGIYALSDVFNALVDTNLESPIPPFGGVDHFSLGNAGLAFVAKDPAMDTATNTKASFYYLPIDDFTYAPSVRPGIVEFNSLEGGCSSPAISPDGRSAAFLQMKKNGYESDKNRIVLIPDLEKLSVATEVLKSDDGKGAWDRSPQAVMWSSDGKKLFLQAEDNGNGLLFKINVPATPEEVHQPPEKITTTGYVSDVHPAREGSSHLLISSSNLVDNSLYTIVDPSGISTAKQISSSSRNGTALGLSKEQVSDIWFRGAGDYKFHAWVVKPSNFNESEKYPLAYLIHGGPQGAWRDQWSTRWNPAVFAEQGYIVITPNPTGSTGYGQEFTDAITNSWGGLPYEDISNGFEYIKENLPYVDTERAVALGPSYGGYMMNWIQGHDLGRKFKALVCHDGVFSIANQMSSDEQYFPNHDLGGTFWTARENWERWDPARFLHNWATPQLIIHNELDYRLPISEGLAAFNVLQMRGVPSQFLTFPDENHFVLKEENSLVWHTVVLNWINKYVGLPPYKEDGVERQDSSPLLPKSDSSLPIR